MVPARPGVLWHLLTPRRYLDPGYLRSAASTLYGGTARTSPAQVELLLRHSGPKALPSGYAHQLLAGAGWTSLPFLPLITQPTLVLAGDDDPIIPLANSRLLSTLIPHAHRHIYRGGHIELVCSPDRLIPAIERHLRGRHDG